MKDKLHIITVKNMITPKDLTGLTSLVEVTYLEKERIAWEEIVDITLESKYLMLNYDVIKELPAEFFDTLKKKNSKLEVIATDMTDMSWVDTKAAQKNNITLLNIPNYSTVSVAEFIVSSALMHLKKINQALNTAVPLKNDTLLGKTVGIVGFGNIGSYTAKLFKGLGMKVLIYNRTLKPEVEYVQVSLETIFKESDIVILSLKTNNETHKIINKKVLNMAKKGQIIINQANAELIDHDALHVLLSNGHIAGYSTQYNEIKNHPLIKLDSVSAFPSQAWLTDHSLENLKKIWVSNALLATHNSFPNQVEL